MTRPPCKHWTGSECRLGLFGGRPSPGVCQTCDKYAGGPRGLGDLVELATKVTGIKAVTEAVAKRTGRDCGCGRRRDKLNKAVPFEGATDDL
jgi:hypothetical protein